METKLRNLQTLIPDAKIEIAHGKMNKNELETANFLQQSLCSLRH